MSAKCHQQLNELVCDTTWLKYAGWSAQEQRPSWETIPLRLVDSPMVNWTWHAKHIGDSNNSHLKQSSKERNKWQYKQNVDFHWLKHCHFANRRVGTRRNTKEVVKAHFWLLPVSTIHVHQRCMYVFVHVCVYVCESEFSSAKAWQELHLSSSQQIEMMHGV